MKLVYIGEDGKRGLKHGQEYEVYVDGSRVTVGKRNGFSLVTMLIVYPNTVRLAKDWAVQGEEFRVGTITDAGEDVATRLELSPYADPKEVTARIEQALKKAGQIRPRICDILGVEVGERFRIDYPKGMTNWLFIDEDGVIRRENGDDRKKIGNSVAYAVNHPEKIIRKPRFTPEEVERAKALKVLCPCSKTISNEGLIVESISHLFPSLKDGETVTLDEILACEG